MLPEPPPTSTVEPPPTSTVEPPPTSTVEPPPTSTVEPPKDGQHPKPVPKKQSMWIQTQIDFYFSQRYKTNNMYMFAYQIW